MKSCHSFFISIILVIFCCSVSFAATPTVVSISPLANATNVALNTKVSVTFSTGMNVGTVNSGTFYIKDSFGNAVSATGPVASNSKKTFTLTPTPGLSPCSLYKIYVTTGNSLGTQYTSTFTTVTSATAPTIASKTPASGAVGVVESNPITVKFDRLMDPLTINATTFGLDNGATGNITFTSTGNVTNAVYTPSPNLVSSTLYNVTVDSAAQSACGTPMASSSTWSFTVRDTAQPYVTSTVPSNGLINISRTSPITINFSEPMQTLTGSNITVTDGVSPVTGVVTFDTVSKLTATFTPSTQLLFNTNYTVTVSGAKDTVGNALAGSPYSFTFRTVAQEIISYCNIPPYISKNVLQPNVLLIMDNSNSMDEDFNGAAVGSYSPVSKSVSGKTALRNVVQKYSDSMRIGLMTYKLPSVTSQYISNSGYFVSYEPKSYCPVPPVDSGSGLDYCFDYCSTGSSQSACRTGCQAQNASFDETYMDEAITIQGYGSRRSKYCGLVYPKTSRAINPSDPTKYIYYKQALPYYSPAAPGTAYLYAQNYHPLQEIINTSTATDKYDIWGAKSGTSDADAGYSGSHSSSGFTLTDSDLAAGYGNIGRRNFSVQIGKAWFANSSPGIGYMQIPVDSNDNVNTQKNKLLTKLTTYSGNQTGYMACTSTSDPNTCSYIVNAGLTPTAGTLKTATDYFTGNSSPIMARCQQNFIIYVTDGLPSVNESGTVGNATTLIGTDASPAAGTVLNRLDGLRAITKTVDSVSRTFDVKTYVLGLGLTSDAKTKLELMASHGGTSQAYYADDPTQLDAALDRIFNDINSQVSSGTSSSIVNNRGESGANLFQAVFYPKKRIGVTDLNWVGDMQNLWYYLDPLIGTSSMREDTNSDRFLDLKNVDEMVTVENSVSTGNPVANWFFDTTGSGSFTLDTARSPGITDDIRPLWRAGNLLHYRSAASRKIFTTTSSYDSSGQTLFTTAYTSSLQPFMNVSSAATAGEVINYIRGVDYPGNTAYRNRSVSITYGSNNPSPLQNLTVPDSLPSPAAGVGVWKLGDIISSTPQSQTSKQLNGYDSYFKDNSYSLFYKSNCYRTRNMAYVAANDGMLHAFRIGQVSRTSYDSGNPSRVSRILNLDTSLNLGDEEWAFIPKNALPYLKYYGDAAYNHLYYVDNTVTIFDASINMPSDSAYTCTQEEYWKCEKKTTYDTSNKYCSNSPTTVCTSNSALCGTGSCDYKIDAAKTSWQTILIGGMGLGGASRDYAGYCNLADGSTPVSAGTETRYDCVKSPLTGEGLSSFYALDITDPKNPTFKWEFSDAVLASADKGLGYSTSGPAIVRISARNPDTNNYGKPDLKRNGRRFAVFATGPSGPIDTVVHQFYGRSDNTLKIYVVDVNPDMTSGWVKNKNYWVIDSSIKNAFAGDISDSVMETDSWNSGSNGYYSDDVLYIGFTKPDKVCSNNQTTKCTSDASCSGGGTCSSYTWTNGGVLRLLTNDSLNPADWTLSTLIDNVGPVTSSPTKLQDLKNRNLWVFFGTGRYYYKDGTGSDDASSLRHLVGVKESCYGYREFPATCVTAPYSCPLGNFMNSGVEASVKVGCASTPKPTLSLSDLVDQSSTLSTLSATAKGWYITLDPAGTYSLGSAMTSAAYDAERVITNTTAASNGVVFFTTFKPTNDICGANGNTLLWAVDYLSGGVPPATTLIGKILVQLSGGAYMSVDLSSAFKSGGDTTQMTRGDRRLRGQLSGSGISGNKGPNIQSATPPVKKIMHIMEK